MQSIVIIFFSDNSSAEKRPSLSPRNLCIVIPFNSQDDIPVVPVSWTFPPFFFNASAIFYTRWLLPVPADPKIKRL